MAPRAALLLLLACCGATTTGVAAAAPAAPPRPPRLLMSIIVDDLGHGDLGFTGSQIKTPHLDRLRAEGVALTSFYVQPICTPSRAAFLTGRYPLLLGLQGKQTVQQGCAWGLDVAEQTFASALQRAGFATHMVGKAHLGADVWRRTPTYRGFDSFVGYLYGAEDYYTHKLGSGFDLRNDTGRECGPGCSRDIAAAHNGTYSSALFGAEVARLVAAAAGPTYIHFTPQSVHAPNEAPAADVAPYVPVFGPGNPVRAVHAGALAALDAAIGTVLAAVDAAGLANDTLIVLHADNGGPLGPTGDGTQASNWPRRGGKHSVFEGGVRALAYAWGPPWLGAGVNRSWDGLAHVTDVGLTLLDAAGVAPLAPLPGRPVSGRSFWAPLVSRAAASGRSEVVINVDYTAPAQAAIVMPRNGSRVWKLILGAAGQTVGPPQLETTWSGWDGLPESPQPGPPPPPAPPPPGGAAPGWPLYDMRPTLFDLAADPRETRNVSALFPDVVAELTARLAAWAARAVPVVENATADPRANPALFNGSWTPWLGLG